CGAVGPVGRRAGAGRQHAGQRPAYQDSRHRQEDRRAPAAGAQGQARRRSDDGGRRVPAGPGRRRRAERALVAGLLRQGGRARGQRAAGRHCGRRRHQASPEAAGQGLTMRSTTRATPTTPQSHIIAHELGVNLRQTSGPVLERAGDLAALLTNLEPHDVLFIDEIHRLSPVVEEILYPALEDFKIDIMIGEGPAARSVKLDLQPFTLVGATTRAGMLTNPLRDRFGIVARLEFYTPEELTRIVTRSARLLEIPIEAEGATEIARRSRGTPRIANRLLRRVRDFAEVKATGIVTAEVADQALRMLDVDALGLDVMDRKLLRCVLDKFGGGPVGVDNLAAAIGEERDTIEDVLEPFLIQQGFLKRTSRGRVATPLAYPHFGLAPPAAAVPDLFRGP